MSVLRTTTTPEARHALLAALGPRYLWWAPADGREGDSRLIAQIMDLGTYDDIRHLESLLSEEDLADVLRRAQPGWFSDRSWSFWRGRLSESAETVSLQAPRRRFGDAGTA